MTCGRAFSRYFFFQAEDGIRYLTVTGVQTCALPICPRPRFLLEFRRRSISRSRRPHRSDEHTSELQSQSHLVCRLLLEKKKQQQHKTQVFQTKQKKRKQKKLK